LSAKVETLRAEISGSIADHFNQLREDIRSMSVQVAEVLQVSGQVQQTLSRVGLLESMLRIAADRDDTVGTIYCDDSGQVTFVSRSVTQWLQASRSDLLGMRWLNYVTPPERKPFRDEFDQARQDHRELRMTIHMGPHNEEPRAYMLTISPMPDNPPAEAWSGHIRPVLADVLAGNLG
jgi:PAS domain-containing protein